jgi:hypothetical protein
VTDRDPLELRVLAALRRGVESATTVSSRTGVEREDVAAILERGVLDGLVNRLDLAGTPVYSLTPQGVDVVGEAPAATVAPADPPPASDSEVAMPSVTMPTVTYAESSHLDRGEVPPRLPEPSQPRERAAPRTVVWRHVVYAVAYLVLGVAFLVVFHSWVGLFAVFAGLVLGGVALRPLLRSGNAPPHD